MSVAAYHRHGCSQSGKRLIVWPHSRHRYRRTHIRIHPLLNPQTWRQYSPCPSTRTRPASRATCPHCVQNRGRSSSTEGAPTLRAHSCSTPTLKLCRMTTVSVGGGFRFAVSPKKAPQPPPFPSKTDGDHPTQIFKSCLWRRALAGNLVLGTAVIPGSG